MPGRKAPVATLWRVSSSVPATSTATSLGGHRLESMAKGGERTSHLPWSHLPQAKLNGPKPIAEVVTGLITRSLPTYPPKQCRLQNIERAFSTLSSLDSLQPPERN